MTNPRARATRPSALLAAALLGLPLALGACSGGDVEAYCEELAGSRDQFEAIDSGEAGSFAELIDVFERLGDAAPDEVSEQWATLNEGTAELEDRLDEAGLSVEDLDAMVSGDAEADMDLEKLEEVGAALEGFGGEEFETAADEIAEHAKTECDIDLEG
ncbi:hypothetical protein NOK12_37810 [Nocardioides sp. OK12]|uniref:hypothetical protein n=1 Tax=Nocardioides sp. OK12 TaxID=2758661 RepID=UPI0021C2C9D2|nr:hypothetical protein [Nocardioides sp. OK12]GHJ61263.1 hypothetical protein NOK12_37810 [Nocardioides sp. OK12]